MCIEGLRQELAANADSLTANSNVPPQNGPTVPNPLYPADVVGAAAVSTWSGRLTDLTLRRDPARARDARRTNVGVAQRVCGSGGAEEHL